MHWGANWWCAVQSFHLDLSLEVSPGRITKSCFSATCSYSDLLTTDHWKLEIFTIRSPKQTISELFVNGMTNRFRIGFKQQLKSLKSTKWNLSYALWHPDTVDSYLTNKNSAGWAASSFPRSLVPHAHVSLFGVIPKSHQPNKINGGRLWICLIEGMS